MKAAALAVIVSLHPAADPIPEQSKRFSCTVVQRLVRDHGEAAVIMGARMRGLSEAVIEAIRKRCLE